ncbi:hypothetical protein BDR04DRAFT_1111729 [Suillus decipiens]|nr:hypothetical protein BDR04DRAFT_1111729 [Suillus decipiens]
MVYPQVCFSTRVSIDSLSSCPAFPSPCEFTSQWTLTSYSYTSAVTAVARLGIYRLNNCTLTVEYVCLEQFFWSNCASAGIDLERR